MVKKNKPKTAGFDMWCVGVGICCAAVGAGSVLCLGLSGFPLAFLLRAILLGDSVDRVSLTAIKPLQRRYTPFQSIVCPRRLHLHLCGDFLLTCVLCPALDTKTPVTRVRSSALLAEAGPAV